MDTQGFPVLRGFAAGLAFGLCLLASGAVFAQAPAVDDASLTALEAYTQRDYPHALELYKALTGRFPKDATYPFMMAKCYNRTGQPSEALGAIDRAIANGAAFAAVEYERGRAYFLLGDDQKAVESYAAYHAKTPGDAVSNQYYAEALSAVGRNQEALDRLAKIKPPQELYFRQEILLATAEAGLDKTQEALARLDRLAGAPLDLETRRFLYGLRAQIENKATGAEIELAKVVEQPERRPWNASITLGGEFDSNVPTLGKPAPGIARPQGLEHHNDKIAWRGYAQVHGDYRWQATDRFAILAAADFYGNQNGHELSEFDVRFTEIRLAPEYRLIHQIYGGVEVSRTDTTLDGGHFESSWGTKPYLRITYSPYVATRLSFAWRHEEFYFNHDANPLEDLDNIERRFEIANEVKVKGTKLVLRGGFYYEHVNAQGPDSDHNRAGWFAGFRYELPWEFFLSGGVDYSAAHYRFLNSRLSFQDTRQDKDRIYNISLTREIVKGLEFTIYDTNYDEESNVPEFFYHRNIIGGSATYRF